MIYILLVLFGLVIGSFIGAVSYRIPRKLGFVKGRSFCDSCKTELVWYDNIPVISYLLYQGSSRCCHKKISIRYPLIELFSVLGILVLYFTFGFSMLLATHYLLLILTLLIFIIDFEHQIIPDELSILIFLLGLFTLGSSLFIHLFPAFLSALLLLNIHLITLGRGMGLGDVKLAIALGVWLSLFDNIKWLTVSFIIGGIVAVVLLLLNKAQLKTKIAFGPFLIIGFWIVYIMNI